MRRAAVRLHAFWTLGWDVAITAEGPVMLEANMRFDVAVNQVASDRGLLATSFAEIMKKYGAFDKLGLFRRLP